MKKRITFISNSSSSSFIVISNDDLDQLKDEDVLEVPTVRGEYEFGWQEERYDDFYSKLNFCVLQCQAVWNTKGEEWFKMLQDVVKEKLNIDLKITNGVSGYIDHQSSAVEGSNTEMFDNKEDLKQFLFSSGSYIQNDNDNH